MFTAMISKASTTVLPSKTVLGKRKHSPLILHLVTEPRPPAATPPIMVNGSLVTHTNKRYKCTYKNCEKSYSKPSRLAEHERSHTGKVGTIWLSLDFHRKNTHSAASVPLRYLQQIVLS